MQVISAAPTVPLEAPFSPYSLLKNRWKTKRKRGRERKIWKRRERKKNNGGRWKYKFPPLMATNLCYFYWSSSVRVISRMELSSLMTSVVFIAVVPSMFSTNSVNYIRLSHYLCRLYIFPDDIRWRI